MNGVVNPSGGKTAPDPAVLLAGAERTTIFQDAARALIEETKNDPFDRYRAERDRDWNFLRNKILGCEFE